MLNIKIASSTGQPEKLQPHLMVSSNAKYIEIRIHDGSGGHGVLLAWIRCDGRLGRVPNAKRHLDDFNYENTGIQFDNRGRIKHGN